MRILIFGAKGQLGTELNSFFSKKYDILGVDLPEVDITKIKDVQNVINQFKPEIVINSAAYADVDGCENYPDRAFSVNSLAVRNIAVAAEKVGAKVVYISTDYVFDGQKNDPYREYDLTNPINVYGWSKLQGEEFVRNLNHRHFILRIAWLYGRTGKNFIKTFLSLLKSENELKIVNDQWGTPTSALNIARQIDALINTDLYGTYHCTCQGGCTWLEYSVEILKFMGYEITANKDNEIYAESIQEPKRKVKLKPVTMAEFPRPAKRPRYSVLDNYYLRLQGIDVMLPWQEALREFFEGLKKEGDVYESLGISRR